MTTLTAGRNRMSQSYDVTATAQRDEPAPPPIKTVTLTMPYDVAATLARLLAMVGGDPRGTYREHINPVLCALEGAGVHWLPQDRRFSVPTEFGLQALPLR